MLVDHMNYHYADRVYTEHGLEDARSSEYFFRATRELRSL